MGGYRGRRIPRVLRQCRVESGWPRAFPVESVLGIAEMAPVHFIGIKNTVPSLDALGPAMREDLERLRALFEEKGWALDQPAFALYYKMDKVTTASEFVSAIPVSEPVAVEVPFVCEILPVARTFTVRHTGSYHYLGNAWFTAMTIVRRRKIKVKKKPMGLERYLNKPSLTAPEDLQTEIVLFPKLG